MVWLVVYVCQLSAFVSRLKCFLNRYSNLFLVFVLLSLSLTRAEVLVKSVPGNHTIRTGVPFEVSVASAFEDTNGNSLSYSFSGLPNWMRYGVEPEYVSQINFPSQTSSFQIAGDIAVVTTGGDFYLINVSNAANMSVIASETDMVPNSPYLNVHIFGDVLFLGAAAEGLFVVNISDPTQPQFVSQYPTFGSITDIELDAETNVLFVAAGSVGLLALDANDLSLLTQISNVTAAGSISKIRGFMANALFVHVDSYGLFSYNVSDPLNMTLLDMTIDVTNDYRQSSVIGNRAYLAYYIGSQYYIAIYDVSDPSSFQLLNAWQLSNWFDGPGFRVTSPMHQIGSYLYVPMYYNGVLVLDVVQPTAIKVVQNFAFGYNQRRVHFSDQTTFLLHDTYLTSIDGFHASRTAIRGCPSSEATQFTSITVTATNQFGESAHAEFGFELSNAMAVSVISPTTHISAATNETVVFNIGREMFNSDSQQALLLSLNSSTARPDWVRWYPASPRIFERIVLSWLTPKNLGGYAEHMYENGGHQASSFRIKYPSCLHRVSNFVFAHNNHYSLAVVPSTRQLFLGHHGTVRTLTLSDTGVASYFTYYFTEASKRPNDMFVKDELMYIAVENWSNTLEIYNVTKPSRRLTAGLFTGPLYPKAIVVVRSYAYMGHSGGIQVLDVTNPANIASVGTVGSIGSIKSLVLYNDTTLIAGSETGLVFFDVVDGSLPQTLSNFAVGGSISSIKIENDLVFICAGKLGVLIVDATNVSQPELVGSVSVPNALDVYLAGNIMYVASGYMGLYVVEFQQFRVKILPDTRPSSGTFSLNLQASDTFGSNDLVRVDVVFDVSTTGSSTTSSVSTGVSTTGRVSSTTGLVSFASSQYSSSPDPTPASSGMLSSSTAAGETSSSMTDSIEAVPAAGGSSGEAVVGAIVGAVVGVCFVLLIVAAVVVWFVVRRSRQQTKPKESNVELQSDQMAYQKGSKSVFEALLESYELYDKRFRLLTTINQPLAIEIKKQVGYDFQKGKPIETEVSGVLGSGNFGETMFAYDQQNKMFVLCKVIRGADACQNSQSEAEMHRLVSGKAGVIALLKHGDFTTSNDDMRYVTFLEYANFGSGEKLALLLTRVQSSLLKTKLIAHCVNQLLNGLLSLKQAKLFHADIKLSNIVCHIEDGEDAGKRLVMKLIDFGCSQVIPEGSKISSDIGDTSIFSLQRVNLHKKRQFQGMSEGTLIASKEDIWAMGLALFELVTGKDSSTLFMSHAYLSDRSVPLLEQSEFDAKKSAIVELQDTEEDSVFDLINLMLTVDASSRASVELLLRHAFVENNTFSDADEETKAVQMLFKNNELPVADTQQPEQAYAKSPPTKEVYLKNGTQVREKPRHGYQNVDHYTGVWFDERTEQTEVANQAAPEGYQAGVARVAIESDPYGRPIQPREQYQGFAYDRAEQTEATNQAAPEGYQAGVARVAIESNAKDPYGRPIQPREQYQGFAYDRVERQTGGSKLKDANGQVTEPVYDLAPPMYDSEEDQPEYDIVPELKRGNSLLSTHAEDQNGYEMIYEIKRGNYEDAEDGYETVDRVEVDSNAVNPYGRAVQPRDQYQGFVYSKTDGTSDRTTSQ